MIRAGDSVLSLFSGLLAVSLIIFSGYTLYDTFYVQRSAFSSSWDLADLRPKIIDDDAQALKDPEALKKINEDYRAWLTVYDTTIDYPVLQGPDDVYYASRDINKKTSLTGSIYLAADNTSDFSDAYNLIYGHHMDNKAMFGGLDQYLKEDYFKKHKEAIIVTPDKVYDIQFFATLQTNAYEAAIYSVGPDKDLGVWRDFLQTHGTIYDQAALEPGKKYIALSTCSSAATSGRLVLFGTMTERDIKPAPVGPDDTTPGGDSSSEGNYEPRPHTGVKGNGVPVSKSKFSPRGTRNSSWALVNLIALLATVYIAIPILHLNDKFGRSGKMRDLNKTMDGKNDEKDYSSLKYEKPSLITMFLTVFFLIPLEEIKNKFSGPKPPKTSSDDIENDEETEMAHYDEADFTRKFRIGIIAEIIIAVVSLILFIMTENMSLPMVLIDRWTLIMLVLLLLCWLIDVTLIRYREGQEEE